MLSMRTAITIGLIIGMSACWAAEPAPWPPLPVEDGEAMIPAQEWPMQPGPRSVKVYVRYPQGRMEAVGAGTGLMLSLHNWGGTGWVGTADPVVLANRYDVVAICVDYLQSGPDWRETPPYDFGYLQAFDALRALYFVYQGLTEAGKPFARDRIFATGGSGGGNVTLMANKLAPRTFTCIIDQCGMARLTDDIAFGLEGGSRLDAGYSQDPANPRYLSKDAQALRFVGHPEHLAAMRAIGNTAKIIVAHGATDDVCPIEDAREMVANMEKAGLDVEAIWITDDMIDGETFTSTGHSMGDRTRIVFHAADRYLMPDSPDAMARKGDTDFDRRDEAVRYRTENGEFVISYHAGYPVGRFEER